MREMGSTVSPVSLYAKLYARVAEPGGKTRTIWLCTQKKPLELVDSRGPQVLYFRFTPEGLEVQVLYCPLLRAAPQQIVRILSVFCGDPIPFLALPADF